MSVIIDQFEVIVEPPAGEDERQGERDAGAGQTAPSSWKPAVVAAVFEQMQERRDRVRAH